MKGEYVWWEICITKLIGLAHIWKANYACLFVCFLFFVFFSYLRAISKYKT